MDNWNVLAAQTSSQAIGRDDLNAAVKTRLVSRKRNKKKKIIKKNINKTDRLRSKLCIYIYRSAVDVVPEQLARSLLTTKMNRDMH